jgi:hypothetical protein
MPHQTGTATASDARTLAIVGDDVQLAQELRLFRNEF